jgi:site-specific recombinase XerD
MKQLTLIRILAEFFNSYLPNTKGLSVNTITSYQYAFQLLFEYLNLAKELPPEKVTFRSLTGGVIEEYLCWLESSRKCSAKTRNLRLAAISSFAKFAMRQNLSEALSFGAEVSAIPKKKVAKNDDVVYFTTEEMGILLRTPNQSTVIGRRDTVLMSVLYASGARAQELCDLTVNDVHIGDTTTLRLFGKGAKARVVAIPDNCAKLLAMYMKNKHLNTVAGDERKRHIFSSQTNEHMTISCIEEIVKRHLKSARASNPALFRHKSYSPHSFRHSIAVHMLESGVPLPVIKNFLGHSSIESTLIYATVTPELANRYLKEKGFGAKVPKAEESDKQAWQSLPFLAKKNN